MLMQKKRIFILSLLCVFISSSLFAQNEEKVRNISSKGESIHQQIISETPIYANYKVAQFVDRVGQRIVEAINLSDYYFYVLDAPGINAFTPGHGLIYINRGLLALMTSEAQLAGVLAHEIAHNTQRHLARRQTQTIWTNVAAIAGAVAVGSNGIYNVIQTTGAARLQGFGREMELESDEVGAEFMYAANYDPEAMLGVLSILKDHERVQDVQSLSDGGDATYHGVFSSHPRSDKRLQEVIQKAGTLPPGEDYRGRDAMRDALEGVIVGVNNNGNKVLGYERFINQTLGVTMLYPESWTLNVTGAKIVLKDAEQTQQLKIEVEKTVDKAKTSEVVLKEKYPQDLVSVEAIRKDPAKDLGTTARYQQERVATINVGRNTYYFQGISRDSNLSNAEDLQFAQIIASFRKAVRSDVPSNVVKTVFYKRLEPGETFASLASDGVLGNTTELQLRLMNGYYPRGEAEPGTWIKLVRDEKLQDQKNQPTASNN